MRRNYEQMTLGDIYSDIAYCFEEEKPRFFRLMEQYIQWDTLIPLSFYSAFYKRMGRSRLYSLESFVCMLVLQKVFHYTEDSQLLNTLRYSKEMRNFCGLKKVPDASKITRFKQDFTEQLEQLFYRLVDLTEPICQAISSELANTLQFDTSGIESCVAENNPKFQSKLLKQAKAFCKGKPDADPYKMVYKLMPDHAAVNSAVNQQHINGHFCYAQKFGIVTNGLGIIRHVSLFDEEFKKRHPDMVVQKKSDNPDADKELEAAVMKHLDVTPQQIRKSQYYDKKHNAYWTGGIGTLVDTEIVGAKLEGNKLLLTMNLSIMSTDYKACWFCKVALEVNGEDYKYLGYTKACYFEERL